MKYLVKTFCCIMFFLFAGGLLLGCGGKKTVAEFAGENNLSMAPSPDDIAKCFAWMSEKEKGERQQYDSLPLTEKGYALMHRETMIMIKSVWGKESNVCKPGTNGWDAYIVAVQEDEKTRRQYSSDAAGVAKVVTLTGGAVKFADSLLGAAGDRIAGNKTVSGRDTKQAEGDIADSSVNEANPTTTSQVQVAAEGDATQNPVPVEQEEVVEEPVKTPVTETVPVTR